MQLRTFLFVKSIEITMEKAKRLITEHDIKDFSKDRYNVLRIENLELKKTCSEDYFLISHVDCFGEEITEEFTESEFIEMIEILKFV